MNRTCLLLLLVAWAPAQSTLAVDYPGPPPGPARAHLSATEAKLENNVLSMQWTFADGRLRPGRWSTTPPTSASFKDKECFSFRVARTPDPAGRLIRASQLELAAPPKIRPLKVDRDSWRLGDRFGGWELSARLKTTQPNFEVEWRASLRDGANYLVQELDIQDPYPLEISDLVLLEFTTPKAEKVGTVDGSPVRAGNLFAAFANPLAQNEVLAAEGAPATVRCGYPVNADTQSDQPARLASVLGVVPEGQLRRGFLYYLERERSRPYHTFLHYNCGYEIGARFWQLRRFGTPDEFERFVGQQEQLWLDRIHTFGRELVEKRGVVLDSFVHDHGWDDTERVWQFHKGYPQGFEPAANAAIKYLSKIGVWFSPWGGYSGRARRVEAGQRQGFETSKMGLTLAGRRYFKRFFEACQGMVFNYDVNYFKFDGFGAGSSGPNAGAYASEVEALLYICEHLRLMKPDVFLNPTSGTWPSPSWLLWADAIWRQESDAGFLGKGSDRQQWLTYRDNATYHGTVQRGPLFPISALMLHGIMIHKLAFKNPYDPKNPGVSRNPADIRAEIRSYFGTGTCMQELHIDPTLMTPESWDILAESARWSRANADVLADTHWIGGDPVKGEVYGWAAWSTKKGTLTLRNPSDQPATIALDLAEAFELPSGAPRVYSLKSPWKEDAATAPLRLSAGTRHAFRLQPFEVLTLEALPSS